MRVLLVEDDKSTSESIKAMLAAERFQVDITALGKDGLEVGRTLDYDLIILDLMLPDIDGYEVLRQLRAADVDSPVLILSGLSEVRNKVRGLGLGAVDYITKPFQRTELLTRIQSIIRNCQRAYVDAQSH